MTGAAPSLLVALAASATLAAPAPSRAEELDRVVAVVRSHAGDEPHVLTRSRLEGETRIALVGRGVDAAQPLDGAALRAGLAWLVDQTLLAEEAARLRVFDVDAEGSRQELERFRARFASPADYRAFLARLDLEEAELEAVLRRTLRVARYLASRMALAARVPEAEVSAWLEARSGEGGDREAARARLGAERTRSETESLLRDLRARAEIRLVSAPGEEG